MGQCYPIHSRFGTIVQKIDPQRNMMGQWYPIHSCIGTTIQKIGLEGDMMGQCHPTHFCIGTDHVLYFIRSRYIYGSF